MFQVRIHGRGGQGVVTAAEMLSIAAFEEGRHAQAFPSFGSERTGAPVVAFCRIADKEIRLREPITTPTLICVGTKDDVAGDAHKLAEVMGNARAVDIPNRDHNRAVGDKVYREAALAFLGERP